ncbi:hypothetical protein AB0872_20650 [Microbacterium sp. NPDC047426]
MTNRPDPSAPQAPQKATEGRQSASEGSSGQRDTPRGQNDAQAGAEDLDGEQRPRGPVDWARQQAAEREQQTAARDETETLTATIGRVRKLGAELFVDGATHTHRAIGRQILNALQPPVPDGTTPAEEARLDRAHWEAKYSGDRP